MFLVPFIFASAAAMPPECTVIHDEAMMVYFDYGSAELGGRTPEMVATAAREAMRENAQRERLTGYCDADETTAGLCPALALHRAEAVKAALVELGLRAELIRIKTGHGHFDSTDQRLNRRVFVDPVPPEGELCRRP
jgi:outer membrane protein OmpA-like peptidoglycan-associated protein